MKNNLTTVARNLRKRSTDAERLLWRHLKDRQLEGLKFRRQEPIDRYIADFVCFEKRIILELDGGQHVAQQEKDRRRDEFFAKEGFKVLRFWNTEVLRNLNGVMEIIRENTSVPSPSP